MKKYLGVKIVEAEPMSEASFINNVKNEDIPESCLCREGYKVIYEDGYVSWSPKDVFEKAYHAFDQQEKLFYRELTIFNDGCWRFTLADEERVTGHALNGCKTTESSKAFPFGTAIEELKVGKKVTRVGWNGKGMYLILVQGYPVNGHLHPDNPGLSKLLSETNPDGTPNITQGCPGQMLSHIVMKTAGESKYWGEGFSDYVPWLASQTDMLAEDWQIVE